MHGALPAPAAVGTAITGLDTTNMEPGCAGPLRCGSVPFEQAPSSAATATSPRLRVVIVLLPDPRFNYDCPATFTGEAPLASALPFVVPSPS